MFRTSEKAKFKNGGHYIKNFNVAGSIIGYILSNPIFRLVST